jgi:hypothetical protein
MEDIYRGYRIQVEGRARFVRVYVIPRTLSSPILPRSYFDFWSGKEEEARAEARRRVDTLLESTGI